MASYSASLKKLVLEQLLSNSKTLEQVQQEYNISRTTLFRWLAQYRSGLNKVNDALNPSALSDFAYDNSASIGDEQLFYGHSKVEHNHEIIKIYCETEHYEHQLSYSPDGINIKDHNLHDSAPVAQDAANANANANANALAQLSEHEPYDTNDQHDNNQAVSSIEQSGFYREFKLSELLQAAIKAQMSLWHGPKCDEITRYYGLSMDKLRHFYELVLQEGLVSGSLYAQMQHQLVAAQEQLAMYEQKVKVLEAKEQLYRFYLDAFKKQSALYKLDFNSLNDALKQDFLNLIAQLRANGLTTQEAADMIGINMRTYYRWLKQAQSHSNDSINKPALGEDNITKIDSPAPSTASDSTVANSSSPTGTCVQSSPGCSLSARGPDSSLSASSTGSSLSSSRASDDLLFDKGQDLVASTKKTTNDKVLHVEGNRPEYKFISTDELELIKEIVLLPEYQGLNIRDCYHKLKEEQLLTMSLSTFYRTINHNPSLKAALKGKAKQAEPNDNVPNSD